MYAAKVEAGVNPKLDTAASSTPISKGDKHEATSPLDASDFDNKKSAITQRKASRYRGWCSLGSCD